MKKQAITAILLAALIAASASCGDSSTTTENGKVTEMTQSGEDQKEDYKYEKNFNGKEFKILSTVDGYTMHMQFDRDEINGETVNDAIYNRNRLVESKLNFKMSEYAVDLGNVNANNSEIADQIRKAVEAGDYLCDLAMIPPKTCAPLFSDSYFYNLKDYDGFRFDESWYNQSYNNDMEIDGKLYFGMSDATVGLTDGMWVLFFNEDKMTDLGLDKPYDLVREGKWTFDRLKEYLAAAANLNGDDSFAWNKNGKCFYGLTMTPYINYRFMNCFGEKIIENKNEKLSFTAGSERFMDAVDLLYTVNDDSLGQVYKGVDSDYDADNGGYVYPFMTERALFLTAEVCKAQKYREFDFTYGIVPFPKYDENQANYFTTIYQDALAFSIPTTCSTPEDTAVIFDALAYEGRKTLVPAYREITVEQKGLRNEDSIEMLDIITKSAYNDIGSMYGLLGSFITDFNNDIKTCGGTMASIIATYKASITAAIDNLNK